MVTQSCKAPLGMGRSCWDYLCSFHRTQEGGTSTLMQQSSPSAAISANYRSNCMDLRVNPGAREHRAISRTAWEWELRRQECVGPCPGLSARAFSACCPTVLHCYIGTKHDNQQVSKNAMPALPSCNFLELLNLRKRKQLLVSRNMGLHLCIRQHCRNQGIFLLSFMTQTFSDWQKCLLFFSFLLYKVSMTLDKTICSPWYLSIFTAEKGRAMHFWQDNRIWRAAGMWL